MLHKVNWALLPSNGYEGFSDACCVLRQIIVLLSCVIKRQTAHWIEDSFDALNKGLALLFAEQWVLRLPKQGEPRQFPHVQFLIQG